MSWNLWFCMGAVNALLSVAAGAFGAHGLKDKVTPRHLEVFETAARYQMYHAFALIAVAWLASRATGTEAQSSGLVMGSGWCFLAGIVLFSGSLYAIVLTGLNGFGRITPIGGLLFIIGWALIAWAAGRTAI